MRTDAVFSALDAPSIDQEFEAWYKRYPKKVARGAAIKAYRAARKKASAADLLTGLQAYTAETASFDRRYIAQPATWLNQERWLDEAPKVDPISDRDHARRRCFETRGI